MGIKITEGNHNSQSPLEILFPLCITEPVRQSNSESLKGISSKTLYRLFELGSEAILERGMFAEVPPNFSLNYRWFIIQKQKQYSC